MFGHFSTTVMAMSKLIGIDFLIGIENRLRLPGRGAGLEGRKLAGNTWATIIIDYTFCSI